MVSQNLIVRILALVPHAISCCSLLQTISQHVSSLVADANGILCHQIWRRDLLMGVRSAPRLRGDGLTAYLTRAAPALRPLPPDTAGEEQAFKLPSMLPEVAGRLLLNTSNLAR